MSDAPQQPTEQERTAEGAFARAHSSALRASMDAARNTVAYWQQAYEDERDENQRLRAKLRQTKKYLRDANKGAQILSLAFQLATSRNVIRDLKSSQNDEVSQP